MAPEMPEIMSASASGGSTGSRSGKPGAVGEAAHRLDHGAEAGELRVGPRLPEAGDAHDDESGLRSSRRVGRKAHRLEHAGPEILDEHVGAVGELLEHRLVVVARGG